MGFLVRVLVNALAIFLVATLIPGLEVEGIGASLLAGLILALVNAVIRPILVILTLPLTLVTLGLFILVLNGFCLWLASTVVPGFAVHGFWAAVSGALLVSFVSWVLTVLLSDQGRVVVITHHTTHRRRLPDSSDSR